MYIKKAAGTDEWGCLSHSRNNRYQKINKAWEKGETAEMSERKQTDRHTHTHTPPRDTCSFSVMVLHPSLKIEVPEVGVREESRVPLWKS